MTRCFLAIFILLSQASCAYRWGVGERKVPGGYDQIAIPVFANKTSEVGIEVDFTNALIRRFERSQVAKVIDKSVAPVRLEGVIEVLTITRGPGIVGGTDQEIPSLPQDTVLTTEYILTVGSRVQLKRQSDEKVVWEGVFSNQVVHKAPRIGEAVVNSANANYNQSARRQALAELAEEMMKEAHDRITESF